MRFLYLFITGLFLGYTVVQTPWIIIAFLKSFLSIVLGKTKKVDTMDEEIAEKSNYDMIDEKSFKKLEKKVENIKVELGYLKAYHLISNHK